MTTTATPDGSRTRPVEPFYAAVLASPSRLEGSTRPAVMMTGKEFSDMIQARYDKWMAEIAAANAAGWPRPSLRIESGNLGAAPPEAEPANENIPAPVRRRRRPVPAHAAA